MNTANPVELLFGTYRRQILALLLLRDEGFHVREIARLTRVPAGSLHRELRALADAGLLLRETAGNQVRYQANRRSLIYPELAEIFRKTVGLADVVRDALAPFANKIAIAFIFGSVARGKETASSDIDVIILGKLPFARVVGALAPLRDRLGREINPVVMSKAEFQNKYREEDRFVRRIAREPKLFLIGTADDFGKLVKDRTA
ncbi:MAG TPA: nucleotidyltransferase domain-containing protein [Burkholderiales bacterium]|nr:nucleotidyltransferase domain-containing protein [Burkholderiales bacterium]